MNGEYTGLLSGSIFLAMFGIIFNQMIDWAFKNGWGDKYLAYFVIGGVTVIGLVAGITGIVDWDQVGHVAILCAAAGAPMAIGEARRAVRREQQAYKELIDGDESETLAQ